jgi:uncharacterized protein
MRFTPEQPGNLSLISGHGAGTVRVGNTTLERPFILSNRGLDTRLAAAAAADLGAEQLEQVLALAPQLVIVGAAGGYPRVPAPWRATLLSRGIGVELMELGAACRTYNLLLQEGRVVVALFFPQAAAASAAAEKGA